jgi:hypothetical protein
VGFQLLLLLLPCISCCYTTVEVNKVTAILWESIHN